MTEKSEAVRRYSTTKLASVSGLMLEYKPSTALPQNWYDPAGPVWTSYSFEVTKPAHAQPQENAACGHFDPTSISSNGSRRRSWCHSRSRRIHRIARKSSCAAASMRSDSGR